MEQLKKGYKKTEVGTIPEDWDVMKFGEIGSCIIGLTYSPSNIVNHGTLVLRSSNVQENKLAFNDNVYVNSFIPDNLKIKEGDILICVRNGSRNLIGKCALLDNRVVGETFGAFMSVYRTRYSKYIFQAFQSNDIKRQIDENLGATINQITNKVLNSFVVALPPTLTEQKAIADALTDVDELIINLEKLIAKKKAIKQGAMQQLLTPPNKGGKRLEGFSGDWEEIDISSLAHIVGGGTPSTSNFEFWNGNINWFTPTEIGDEKYSIESLRKISAEGLKSSSARMLPKGTVLMTTRASIGDLSILECEACTNQGFQSLVPINKNDSEFIYYIMSTLKKSMLNLSSGSTFLEISPNKLKLLRFFIPISIDERLAIANVLKQIDDEFGLLLKRKVKLMQIKQGMMQELLTGKTRLV